MTVRKPAFIKKLRDLTQFSKANNNYFAQIELLLEDIVSQANSSIGAGAIGDSMAKAVALDNKLKIGSCIPFTIDSSGFTTDNSHITTDKAHQ